MGPEEGCGGDDPQTPGKQMAQSVVAVCASHVDTERRFGLLMAQLASLAAQTRPVEVHLGVSFAPGLGHLRARLFAEVPTCVTVYVTLNPSGESRVAQFRHYSRLARALPADAWCLFCDDDDFCHPRRAEIVADNLREGKHGMFEKNGHKRVAAREEDEVFWATTVLFLDEPADVSSRALADVQAALDAGKGLSDQQYREAKKEKRAVAHVTMFDEHQAFGARARVLRRFCEVVDAYLDEPLCDLVWTWLLHATATLRMYPSEENWMYAYSCRPDPARGSRTTGADQYVRLFPARLFEDLAAAFPRVDCALVYVGAPPPGIYPKNEFAEAQRRRRGRRRRRATLALVSAGMLLLLPNSATR